MIKRRRLQWQLMTKMIATIMRATAERSGRQQWLFIIIITTTTTTTSSTTTDPTVVTANVTTASILIIIWMTWEVTSTIVLLLLAKSWVDSNNTTSDTSVSMCLQIFLDILFSVSLSTAFFHFLDLVFSAHAQRTQVISLESLLPFHLDSQFVCDLSPLQMRYCTALYYCSSQKPLFFKFQSFNHIIWDDQCFTTRSPSATSLCFLFIALRLFIAL